VPEESTLRESLKKRVRVELCFLVEISLFAEEERYKKTLPTRAHAEQAFLGL
jgi:hypothetical protein